MGSWTNVPLCSLQGPQQGMLEGDFALCISLYHGYELLMQMGLRSLFCYVQGIMDGSRGQWPSLQAAFSLVIHTNSYSSLKKRRFPHTCEPLPFHMKPFRTADCQNLTINRVHS